MEYCVTIYAVGLQHKQTHGFDRVRAFNPRVAKMEELITIQQLANYLKVDRFTVYRLVTQKRIPAFKVGGQWRFKQEMIDSWLMRNSNMKKRNQDYVELHETDSTS